MERILITCILMSWVVLGAGNPSAWAKSAEAGQSLEERDPFAWNYDSFLDPNHLPLEEELSEGEF